MVPKEHNVERCMALWQQHWLDFSRYPVILQEFSVNAGTGGAGQFHGGDGVIRELQFRRPLSFAILSERRVHSPYGLQGNEISCLHEAYGTYSPYVGRVILKKLYTAINHTPTIMVEATHTYRLILTSLPLSPEDYAGGVVHAREQMQNLPNKATDVYTMSSELAPECLYNNTTHTTL